MGGRLKCRYVWFHGSSASLRFGLGFSQDFKFWSRACCVGKGLSFRVSVRNSRKIFKVLDLAEILLLNSCLRFGVHSLESGKPKTFGLQGLGNLSVKRRLMQAQLCTYSLIVYDKINLQTFRHIQIDSSNTVVQFRCQCAARSLSLSLSLSLSFSLPLAISQSLSLIPPSSLPFLLPHFSLHLFPISCQRLRRNSSRSYFCFMSWRCSLFHITSPHLLDNSCWLLPKSKPIPPHSFLKRFPTLNLNTYIP